MKLELDAPNIGTLEKRYINRAIEQNFVSTFGPFVPKFEKVFSGYIGAKGAVSLQSGTAAIHMVLHELKIGEDDEVIAPALTFVATVNPILYVGARPVFVDVDRRTWNIDPKEIESHLTKKTKAILPVHLYGNPAAMDEIMRLAKKHRIYVIEDATESLGAKYLGKHTGTLGDFGCFSFNGNKIITTGGGGMVVGKDANRLEHIKFLINQARDTSDATRHPEVGFNYRMTNIEASLGLAQMKRLSKLLSKKKGFNEIYRNELRNMNIVEFQEEYEDAESSWWLTCITFNKKVDIISLQKKLKNNGVPTRRIFMPLVEFPPYHIYKQDDYKNSYALYESSLCLPSSTLNSYDDIYYACKIIKKFFRS